MDYSVISQGLLYMIGPKAYFYRFYMVTMIVAVWVMRLLAKPVHSVKKNFQRSGQDLDS